MKKGDTVWISKYALTRGIFRLTVEDVITGGVVSRFGDVFTKDDWHLTLEEAQAKAVDMAMACVADIDERMRNLQTEREKLKVIIENGADGIRRAITEMKPTAETTAEDMTKVAAGVERALEIADGIDSTQPTAPDVLEDKHEERRTQHAHAQELDRHLRAVLEHGWPRGTTGPACVLAARAFLEGKTAGPTDAEKQAAIWREMQERVMPCGHKMENLIGGEGAVTKCGACLEERNAAKQRRSAHMEDGNPAPLTLAPSRNVAPEQPTAKTALTGAAPNPSAPIIDVKMDPLAPKPAPEESLVNAMERYVRNGYVFTEMGENLIYCPDDNTARSYRLTEAETHAFCEAQKRVWVDKPARSPGPAMHRSGKSPACDASSKPANPFENLTEAELMRRIGDAREGSPLYAELRNELAKRTNTL